ncbi:MAG: hypothetical protein QNK27_00915 [Desulfuromusa sp.]|nr:hypothetical protein [Desulfuromusa sp.]
MAKILRIVLMLLLFGVAGNCCAATAEKFVDPMRPLHYQTPAAKKTAMGKKIQVNTKSWQLTAVLISAGRSVAVINGKSLQVGAQLDGYKLVRIDSDQVVLKNKQRTLTLRRAGTGLKKMSTDRDIRKGSKP